MSGVINISHDNVSYSEDERQIVVHSSKLAQIITENDKIITIIGKKFALNFIQMTYKKFEAGNFCSRYRIDKGYADVFPQYTDINLIVVHDI